jgi:hypothetical protein
LWAQKRVLAAADRGTKKNDDQGERNEKVETRLVRHNTAFQHWAGFTHVSFRQTPTDDTLCLWYALKINLLFTQISPANPDDRQFINA